MAPIVAALLKGGMTLLGNAVLAKGKEWVEEKTGVTLEAEMPPEKLAALRQYELEHEEELQRIQLENNKVAAHLEEAYLEDRQDARKRDVAFVAAGKRNERGDNLAYMAVGGLLAVVLLVFLAPVDQIQKEILLVVLGALIKIVSDVYAFEFGSSKGEQRKDNAMTKWLDEEGQ